MQFRLSPSCKEALGAFVAITTVMAALLTAAVYGVDARIASANAPIIQAITVIQERQAADRAAVAAWQANATANQGRIESGVQSGFATIDAKVDLILKDMLAR